MKSPLIIVCCLLMVCVFATAQEPCPQVIPALQQWKGGKGELALPAEGSIVLSPADEAMLSPTAQILAQDLKELFGWNYVIKTGKPVGKDICLSLSKPDKELGEEGYTLTVNRYAGIAAPTGQGVFWGTRTLLQILHNEQGKLPKGDGTGLSAFPEPRLYAGCGPQILYNGLSETIRKDTFLLQDERISDSLERQRFSAVLRR